MSRKNLRPFKMHPPCKIALTEIEYRWGKFCRSNRIALSQLSEEQYQQMEDLTLRIDEDVAAKLHHALRISPQFWLDAQANYDEWKASES